MIFQVIDGAAGVPFGKVDRDKGLGLAVVPVFLFLVRVQRGGQRKAEREVQRDGLDAEAVVLDLELFAQKGGQPVAGAGGELQAHHIQAAPLFEHLLHHAAEVDVKVEQSLVHRDVGVAGDAHDVLFQHLLLVVQFLHKVQDDVGGEDDLAPLVDVEGVVGGQLGEGDDADADIFLPLLVGGLVLVLALGLSPPLSFSLSFSFSLSVNSVTMNCSLFFRKGKGCCMQHDCP